jgi:hypothetical protein
MSNGETPGRKKPAWPWVVLGCGGGLVVTAVVVAVMAYFVVPSHVTPRRHTNELSAVASLRAYCGAQLMYFQKDWDKDGQLEYASPYANLFEETDEQGNAVQFIDPAFAGARGRTGVPKHGYLFRDMRTVGGREINWTGEFALCAIPAEYDKTGKRTFIVKTDGTVYGKDRGPGADFVDDYPEDLRAAGWTVTE